MNSFEINSYAKAIADLLVEDNSESGYLYLYELTKFIRRNPAIINVWSNPGVSVKKRNELIGDAVDNTYLCNFLKLLNNSGYLMWVLEILDQSIKIIQPLINYIDVTVSSVVPLNENQKQLIINNIHAKTKSKIHFNEVIVPELIGGIKIEYNAVTYDYTLSTKISSIKDSIKGIK